MQQPPNPYPHYPQRQPPMPPTKRKSRKGLFILLGVILAVALIGCIGVTALVNAGGSGTGGSTSPSTPTPTATSATISKVIPTGAPTAKPKPIPTQKPTQIPTPQSIQYPPRTIADLRGLAAKGDASAIHEFHSESVGAVGVCPEPKKEVTVNSSVTGKQLAEDLLAYFYANQLDSPCGSLVLAYHNQGEANDTYTAGRVGFDTTDASGAPNFDPNATNLKYTLTLDIGDVATGQEYVVTY
jgi:hypothetical protein